MYFVNQTRWMPQFISVSAICGVLMLLANAVMAQDDVFDMPLLVVGASYDNPSSPVLYNLQGPIDGFAVSLGEFLSISAALVRDPLTKGFIINEARGGAGTFDRVSCSLNECVPYEWQGFDKQFEKALLRVAVRDADNPDEIIRYNARYMTIGIPNDCLHSNAAGLPQAEAQPCTTVDFNATIDRIKAVAERAIELNITPVIHLYPPYEGVDLSITQALFNFVWVIDEAGYNELNQLHRTRLAAELPAAILVDGWEGFTHIGDGLHPDSDTVTNMARHIVLAIKQHAWQQNSPESDAKISLSFNKQRYQAGDRFSFDVTAYAPETIQPYDIYAALVFPSDYFVTFAANGFSMSFPGTIMPYQTQVNLQTLQAFRVTDITLARGIATGEYDGCVILTPAGTDPWNGDNWITTNCESFVVNDN